VTAALVAHFPGLRVATALRGRGAACGLRTRRAIPWFLPSRFKRSGD